MSQPATRSTVVAFEALFRTYYDSLVALAEWYVGSTEAAEDIVDDVFLALWTQRDRVVVRESVRAYLFGATRNRALNAVRDRKTRARLLRQAEPNVLSLAVPETDASVWSLDLRSSIERAIAQLPPRARTILTLHRQAGLSFAEIADLLGISPRTVETHLARALKTLRRHLTR
jgi:RNA polymerase sigma-70 factor, ECF subfamily